MVYGMTGAVRSNIHKLPAARSHERGLDRFEQGRKRDTWGFLVIFSCSSKKAHKIPANGLVQNAESREARRAHDLHVRMLLQFEQRRKRGA